MFEYAEAAVDGALSAGAQYADARVVGTKSETIDVQNRNVEELTQSEAIGVGVRALIGSSWGFYATAQLTETDARAAGHRAADTAKASEAVPGPPLSLADVAVVEDNYETPFEEDPFAVSLSEKVDMLIATSGAMEDVNGVQIAHAHLDLRDREQWFVSAQGHKIHQHLVHSGGGIDATAVGETETQRRSYPKDVGQYESGGYERIRAWEYQANAPRIAEEAAALLNAPPCPEGQKHLILDGTQLYLHIHESVGHATELDRILGWEAAFAGTSWLELDKLGSLAWGSPLMNITADATLSGALSTFGYDDEGTPGQRVDLVKEGVWVGVLSGRDSAPLAGVPPGGMARGDGYARLPMVRMTNVGLLPGDSSLDEIIAETKDGIYMSTNRSWSIDDKRLNMQFGCEIGWEVEDGKLGRMVRNPTYTGISPKLWANLDMVAGEDEWVLWGTPNCGKGQPLQSARTGHPAAPARFSEVRVGVHG